MSGGRDGTATLPGQRDEPGGQRDLKRSETWMTKEPAMPRPGRTHRLFWIAGILLLVGTVLGAGYVINNGVGKYSATPTSEGDTPAPPGIVSIGHVDMESGVTNLFPVQQG